MSGNDVNDVAPELEFDETFEVKEFLSPPKEEEIKEDVKEKNIEEVIEIEEESETEEEVETEEESEDVDPQAKGIYQTMVDKNYIEENEDFKGTWEEVDAIFNDLPEKVAVSLVNSLPDFAQNLIDFTFTKGADLTKEDLVNFAKAMDNPAVEMNIDTVENQRTVVAKMLKEIGESDEDIPDILDLYEDKGKLEAKAKAYKEAKAKAKASQEEELLNKAKVSKVERKQKFDEFVNGVTGFLKESGWSKNKQKEVYNEIFNKEMNRKSKIVQNHPKALAQLADFMTYFDEKTGEFDLTNFKKAGASKAVKKVKDTIAKNFSDISKSTIVERNNNDKDAEFEFV